MSDLELLERLATISLEGAGLRPDALEALIGAYGVPVRLRRVEGFAPALRETASIHTRAIICAIDRDRRTAVLRTSDTDAMTMPFRKGDLISAPAAHEELEIEWVDPYALREAEAVIAHAHVIPD